jgi:hypothetical protein
MAGSAFVSAHRSTYITSALIASRTGMRSCWRNVFLPVRRSPERTGGSAGLDRGRLAEGTVWPSFRLPRCAGRSSENRSRDARQGLVHFLGIATPGADEQRRARFAACCWSSSLRQTRPTAAPFTPCSCRQAWRRPAVGDDVRLLSSCRAVELSSCRAVELSSCRAVELSSARATSL